MKLLYISGDGWLICEDEDYNDTGGNIEIRNGKYINLLNIPRDAYEAQAAAGGNKDIFFVEHLNDQITTIAMMADLTNNMTDGPVSFRRETIVKTAPPSEAFMNWIKYGSSPLTIASESELSAIKSSGKILDFPGK